MDSFAAPLFIEVPHTITAYCCPRDGPIVNHWHHDRLRQRRLKPGEWVFKEGDPGDYAYIIDQGSIEIFTTLEDQRYVLSVLEPGAIFGELALVDGRTRSASAVACTDTLVTREQVEERIESADPILRMLLFVVLSYLRIESTRFRGRSRPEFIKQLGGSPEIDLLPRISQAVDLIRMESELQQAIEAGELKLVYQPILRLSDQAVVGFEALTRWYSPSRGLVPPSIFMPLAECTSLIVPVGEWVVDNAFQAVQQMEQLTGSQPFISINIANRQLEEPGLTAYLVEQAAHYGIARDRIKLEILERTLMDSDLAPRWMQECRQLGFKLSLDDFGTGYSSLGYLNRYQFDTLKLDRSFVQELEDNANSRSICQAIIDLSHALGMTVVAEGIEEAKQGQLLADMGCSYGQGYFYAKPMPLGNAIEFLQEHRVGSETVSLPDRS